MPIVRHLNRTWQRLALGGLLALVLGGGAVYQMFSQETRRPIPDLPAPVVIGPTGTMPVRTPVPKAQTPEPTPKPTVAPALLPPQVIAPPTIRAEPGVDAPAIPQFPTTIKLETGDRTGSGFGPAISVANNLNKPSRAGLPARNWVDQTQAEADAKSAGCMQCHEGVEPMHKSPFVVLGCTDCHGGNAKRNLAIEDAHPKPTYPEFWRTSANPPVNMQIYNHENPE